MLLEQTADPGSDYSGSVDKPELGNEMNVFTMMPKVFLPSEDFSLRDEQLKEGVNIGNLFSCVHFDKDDGSTKFWMSRSFFQK